VEGRRGLKTGKGVQGEGRSGKKRAGGRKERERSSGRKGSRDEEGQGMKDKEGRKISKSFYSPKKIVYLRKIEKFSSPKLPNVEDACCTGGILLPSLKFFCTRAITSSENLGPCPK
jgi:hypothetical protein